jgi:hypothetical protein
MLPLTRLTPSASRAASPLAIPTYVPDDVSVCHPSVVRAPNGVSWNGYRYWMAYTPLPLTDRSEFAYENPCIVCSNDKVTWVEPITNPLQDTPNYPGEGTNWSDPNLFFDGDTLMCAWRLENGDIYYKSSSNGTTWGALTKVYDSPSYLTHECTAPSFTKVGSEYRLWYMSRHYDGSAEETGTYAALYYRTASSFALGAWSDPVLCTQLSSSTGTPCPFTNTEVPHLWHAEVRWNPRGFYESFAGFHKKNLAYGRSRTGDVWDWYPLILQGTSGWDKSIYKASGIANADGSYDVFYNGIDADSVYMTGMTTMTIRRLTPFRSPVSPSINLMFNDGSFETDTNSDGLADGVTWAGNSGSTGTSTALVTDAYGVKFGSKAQYIKRVAGGTGVAGKTGVWLSDPGTAAGSLAGLSSVTMSAWVKVIDLVHSPDLHLAAVVYDASNTILGTYYGSPLSVNADFEFTSANITLPTGANHIKFALYDHAFATGHTIEFVVDGAWVEAGSGGSGYHG